MILDHQQFSDHAKRIACMSSGGVAFDFETTGLNARDGARAFIMGFTYEAGSFCVYLDDIDRFLIRDFFGNHNIKYAAHNAKFEMTFLRHQFNTEIKGQVWD